MTADRLVPAPTTGAPGGRGAATGSSRRVRRADATRVRRATWKLGLVTGLLVLASVVVTALAVGAAFSHASDAETSDLLRQAVARAGDPATAPVGTYLAVRGPDGLR